MSALCGWGLPEPDDVAFGVLEVREGAIPGISVLGVTVLPPADSICFSESSIDSTSTVSTGAGVASERFIRPPLIAPGSVGSWVCSLTAVVRTSVYCMSGISWSCQSKTDR